MDENSQKAGSCRKKYLLSFGSRWSTVSPCLHKRLAVCLVTTAFAVFCLPGLPGCSQDFADSPSPFAASKTGADFPAADSGPPSGGPKSDSSVEFQSTVKPLPPSFKPLSDHFSVVTTGGNASRFLIEAGTSAAVARKILFTKYDVVVVIDKSFSMLADDCPGGLSRWDWCRDQTADLAKLAQQNGSAGLTLVLFSDDFATYRGCGLDRVPQVFRENRPAGSTNTAAALASVLDDYFMHAWHGSERPLVVAIITDGRPNQPELVKRVISDATHRVSDPDEVRITFLQVGEDPEGYSFARDVDRNLVSQGAAHDIVYSKTFDQLKKSGIVGALLDAITRRPVTDEAPGVLSH